MGMLLLLWSVPALIIIQVWGMTETTGNGVLILLYLLFILFLSPWGRRVHGRSSPLQQYGLELSPRNALYILVGLGMGSLSLGLMFIVESVLGWLTWRQIPDTSIIAAGLGVALAVGFAEELYFRGWFLDELEQDCSLGAALGFCSTVFAALHYLKPWSEIVQNLPQFFGLCLLGATLVWSKRRCAGRLGLAMGLHAGLVWGYYCADVGDWIAYTGAVPSWVTGINGNPLAGVMGLVCLSGIAVGIRYWRFPTVHPS